MPFLSLLKPTALVLDQYYSNWFSTRSTLIYILYIYIYYTTNLFSILFLILHHVLYVLSFYILSLFLFLCSGPIVQLCGSRNPHIFKFRGPNYTAVKLVQCKLYNALQAYAIMLRRRQIHTQKCTMCTHTNTHTHSQPTLGAADYFEC